MIDYNKLDKLTKAFHNAGIKDIRYYISESETDTLSIYEGGVDGGQLQRQDVLFVEGNINGFTGSSYIENLGDEFFDDYIKVVQDTAKYNGKEYMAYDFTGDYSGKESVNFPSNEDIIFDMK
ncbi:MAG: hypothetical protein LBU94_02430, partial [Clostridiales bacterium]|nr:hypothetical protein [Clostridiales bacterium]